MVLIVGGLVVRAVTGGDGDDGPSNEPQVAAATTSVTPGIDRSPISATELAQFKANCTAGGVSDQNCSCVADRAEAELDPVVFRTGLDHLVSTGGELTEEFRQLFDACTE